MYAVRGKNTCISQGKLGTSHYHFPVKENLKLLFAVVISLRSIRRYINAGYKYPRYVIEGAILVPEKNSTFIGLQSRRLLSTS